MSTDARQPIRPLLPLALPKSDTDLSCPICGATVHLSAVVEWHEEDEDGPAEVIHCEYDCETEPDIDSDEWEEWFQGHFRMPYVTHLPWEIRMLKWLNERYVYTSEG